MIDNKVYQNIFNEIERFLPADWSQMIAYFEYWEASYSYEFYVKINEQFIKCYALPNIIEEELYSSFDAIDKIIAPTRSDNGDWTNMTMVVDSNGNMHTDFDYTDLTEGAYQYMKDWKAKYLQQI